MIKPDAVCKMGEIIDLIMESGLLITKLKKITIDRLRLCCIVERALQDNDDVDRSLILTERVRAF